MRKEPNDVNNIYLFASIRNSGLYESFFENFEFIGFKH